MPQGCREFLTVDGSAGSSSSSVDQVSVDPVTDPPHYPIFARAPIPFLFKTPTQHLGGEAADGSL